MPTSWLESELKRLAEDAGCENCPLWVNYQAMKTYLAEHYYPWVQAASPWFTDHGERHVSSVISTADLFLEGLPSGTPNCLDVFLLLSGIIWHDAGMVSQRAGHAKQVQHHIDKVREICLSDMTLYRLIVQIARAHSGPEGLDGPNLSEDCSPCPKKTCTVYPRSLAALLRFADEVSENRTRISSQQLQDVPPDNKLYWEYANCITASKPEPKRGRVLVSIEVQKQAAVMKYDCPSQLSGYADKSGKITLMEYLICRLQKMNNERAYCYPYLCRYCDISSIEIRLQVCEGVDCELFENIRFGDGGLDTDNYPNIEIFKAFFKQHPQLQPSRLARGGNG